jgi:Domain of unknown function (DUF4331)
VKKYRRHSLFLGPRFAQILMVLMVFVALACFALYSPSNGLASDHRDSPTADANAEGDITDIFAFLDPNDASQLVLIMDVNPFAVPAETPTYRFSADFLYQFKIAHDPRAVEDLVIQAVFTDVPTTTCASGQEISIYGPARPEVTGAKNKVLEIRPRVKGCTGQTLQQGSMQVFTGLRDDPFVTDVGQLNRILSNKQDLFRSFPGFTLGPLRGRPVRSNLTSGVDGFGGFNVSSIAIELPKSSVAGSGFLGVKGLVGIWGTTSMKGKKTDADQDSDHDGSFVQFQRVGQQLFKTVFVPSTMREAFNASEPADDTKNWSSLVPDALTITDNDGTGNTIAGRAGLLTALGFTDASGSNPGLGHGAPLLLPGSFNNTNKNLLRVALLPDVLRLNLDLLPAGVLPGAAASGGNSDPQLGLGAFGLQNGRRPADTVTDILLQLARQLADVNFPAGLGVPGSGPARPGALNFATDRRVLAVLQGTDWIKPDAQVGNVSGNTAPFGGNDQPLLVQFPFLAAPHPLPGETGTVGFPPQQ